VKTFISDNEEDELPQMTYLNTDYYKKDGLESVPSSYFGGSASLQGGLGKGPDTLKYH
jgi:hypothetical protein